MQNSQVCLAVFVDQSNPAGPKDIHVKSQKTLNIFRDFQLKLKENGRESIQKKKKNQNLQHETCQCHVAEPKDLHISGPSLSTHTDIESPRSYLTGINQFHVVAIWRLRQSGHLHEILQAEFLQYADIRYIQ